MFSVEDKPTEISYTVHGQLDSLTSEAIPSLTSSLNTPYNGHVLYMCVHIRATVHSDLSKSFAILCVASVHTKVTVYRHLTRLADSQTLY